MVEKLIPVLESKITEGLEELPKLSVKTEEYTICLRNTLEAINLLHKLTYKPTTQPKETK